VLGDDPGPEASARSRALARTGTPAQEIPIASHRSPRVEKTCGKMDRKKRGRRRHHQGAGHTGQMPWDSAGRKGYKLTGRRIEEEGAARPAREGSVKRTQ